MNGTKTKIFLFSLSLLLLPSCNYERIKALSGAAETPKTWYGLVQQTVLAPKCMGCHNPQRPNGGLDISNHDQLMSSNKIVAGSADNSLLFQSVKIGRMPQGGTRLTAQELGLLKGWIDAGASATAPLPEKPAPPVVILPPPVLKATYSSIKQLIIDLRCLGCHNGKNPDMIKLDLRTYDSMMATPGAVTPFEPVDSALLQRLTAFDPRDKMPPLPRPDVPEAERKIIEKWISDGAKNN